MEAPQGGYFLPTKLPYPKPALPIPDQIALYKARGLTVADEQQAAHYLKFIGYYRLSGYARYFADPIDAKHERFKPGTTFQQILDLYIFDRKIRMLLLDALERVEVAAKSTISDAGALHGQGGAFWLMSDANFDRGTHGEVQQTVLDRANDGTSGFYLFIRHFFSTYLEPQPPSWMVMETLSFAEISKIYKRMKGNLRQPVAAHFSVQHDVLQSWLHALAFGRNLCAHHCRVWNRAFTIEPKIPRQYTGDWPSGAKNRLYVFCCVIHHMMDKIADGSEWHKRLRELIGTRPAGLPLAAMGFPEDWETKRFWKF